MIVRPYQPQDFQAVFRLISACAEQDRTRRLTENALRRTLMPEYGAALDALVALTPEQAVAGMMWWDSARSVTRLEGWVHPLQRRKGFGTALLTAAESHVRKYTACTELTARAYEDVPGVEALFRLRGFALERRFYVMSVRLVGHPFEVEPPPGVSVRSFRIEDLEALVEADNEIFEDHWGSHRRSVQAWQREMMELRPHDPALWIVAWVGDDVVGECLCHASREGGPKDAWVSIVGVRREWRGRGLGRAVLARGLAELHNAGFETAALHVDAENSAAINLYRSLEMNVVRHRLHYRKVLQR